jgi:hypothetical protein
VTEPHTHPHSHPHRHEQPLVPARGAVLDIGGDVGALLVQADAALEGAEIELYDERGAYLMHTEVHGRDVSGTRSYAGLFPAVVAGGYLLELGDGSDRTPVTVVGGQVTTVRARVQPPVPVRPNG